MQLQSNSFRMAKPLFATRLRKRCTSRGTHAHRERARESEVHTCTHMHTHMHTHAHMGELVVVGHRALTLYNARCMYVFVCVCVVLRLLCVARAAGLVAATRWAHAPSRPGATGPSKRASSTYAQHNFSLSLSLGYVPTSASLCLCLRPALSLSSCVCHCPC
jgi:hypothetical protein